MILDIKQKIRRVSNDQLLKIQEIVTAELQRREQSQFNNEVSK